MGLTTKLTVVLTGSSGYLGSLVKKELMEIGVNVIEVDQNHRLNPIDLANEENLSKLVLPSSYLLVHLAFPLPGSFKSKEFKKLIERINSNFPKYFQPERSLLISSTAVYPLHFNADVEPAPWEIYGELKLESEKVFASNFSNLTIFRPGTLVEISRKSSMMNFIFQLMRSRIALVPGDGNMVHPFTYTHDLVDAIIRWVKDPSLPDGTFDLTSRKPITFNQISYLSRGSKPFLKLQLPEGILSHIGSDRFPVNRISRWHLRGLFYNYHQQSINVYQETFKEYKEIFTS